LDRLDLTVDSTLDSAAQSAVTAVLKALQDPNVERNNGLYGFRLLQEKDDLSRIVFSFTLVERGRSANLVRIQTDNYDQPFNINEGVKLDLGSTAKLRTLVTYLDVIATLYERYAGAPRKELAKVTIGPNDALSRWAVDFLLVNPQASLSDMLEAAMERQYSANPSERFFTGGGIHTFANFDSLDNNKIMTVRHALHNSVNLVFVRLMRDIVHYYMYQTAGPTAQLLAGDEDARRGEYLAKFADREGSQFVQNFYRKFAHKTQNEILELLMGRGDTKPRRMATIYRSVLPQAGLAEFGGYLLSQLTESPIRNEEITQLYAQNDPAKLSLPDRGFLSRVHPLELWVAQYLIAQPNASLKQTLDASAEDRQAVYQWLFKTRNKKAQDLRIRYLLEVEAFLEIHRQWKRMGYPFDYLVPSYASALGSSGDRPAALAELMGIIANAGVYYPTLRVTGLHFAAQTPYETRLEWSPRPGEQVLAPEVTATLKRALQGVVQLGTARRLNNVFTDAQGNPIAVGGKTGTGDHRRESYGAGGRVIKSEVVNRTATFAFFIGEDHFGTLTAYVPGAAAANYRFTSGLPVQLLKAIAPVLTPMLRAATTTSYSATVPTSGSSIVSGSSGSPRKSSSGTSSSGNSSAGTSSSKPPSSAASSSIIDSSSAGMSSAEPLEESTSGNISPPDPSSDDDMTSSDVPSAEDATATPP
jgi:membrane peptidoglycan carboxypeptidase